METCQVAVTLISFSDMPSSKRLVLYLPNNSIYFLKVISFSVMYAAACSSARGNAPKTLFKSLAFSSSFLICVRFRRNCTASASLNIFTSNALLPVLSQNSFLDVIITLPCPALFCGKYFFNVEYSSALSKINSQSLL